MNPRLTNSKKWTSFPNDFLDQIKEAMLETFGPKLRGTELVIEGRIYPGEILLRVGFIEKNRLKQNNFEVSIDYSKDQAVDRIHDAIDAAASMMADYFESDGEAELPLSWKEYDLENLKVYCQYSTVNTRLESEADRLLGLDDSSLIKAEGEDVDEVDLESPPKDKNKLH